MLTVGQPLYGYCGGYFGRDWGFMSDARIEAVGFDWVVARNEDGKLGFAEGETVHEDLAEHTDPKKSYDYIQESEEKS
jgi:hypothetical protein